MAEAEQLIFGEQKINVYFKDILTGKLRTDIITILKNSPAGEKTKLQEAAIQELTAEGNENITEQQLGIKLLKKGFNIKYLFDESYDEVVNEVYLLTIYKLARIIIDIEKTCKQIKNEELKNEIEIILNGTVEDYRDFWDRQDIGFLEKKIQFFRSKIKSTI